MTEPNKVDEIMFKLRLACETLEQHELVLELETALLEERSGKTPDSKFMRMYDKAMQVIAEKDKEIEELKNKLNV